MKMKLFDKIFGNQGEEPQIAGQISATDRYMYEYLVLPSITGFLNKVIEKSELGTMIDDLRLI